MAELTPEFGTPHINLSEGQAFNPDDTFERANGKTVKGQQLNEALQRYFEESPRGQQLMKHMRGEGPEPEPLFSLVYDESGDGRVLLGGSEVDVTDVEPLSDIMLDEFLPRDGIS